MVSKIFCDWYKIYFFGYLKKNLETKRIKLKLKNIFTKDELFYRQLSI